MENPTRASICLVGAGPRGTSLLERLGANLSELCPEGELDLHLVDPFPPGAGRVWRHDQPRELVMNTLAGAVTNFTDESVVCEGPIVIGPTMFEWCVLLRAGAADEADERDLTALAEIDPEATAAFAAAPAPSQVLADPELMAEVARTEPWSHPSRALYGHYLSWCFTRALAQLPERVRVHHHRELATAVTHDGGRERVTLASGTVIDCDAVVLALGWLDADLHPADHELARGADTDHAVWVRPASPSEQPLDAIAPGIDVIVRGLGMGFFDAMALLTLGRGGVFHRASDAVDGLVYEPSGREPRLHVSSRRGVPFRSKSLYGSLPPKPAQVHLRGGHFDERTDQIDFTREVRPLILKDALRDYYLTLARVRPGALARPVDGLVDAIARFTPGSAELEEAIADAVPVPEDRLDLDALEVPVNRSFGSPEEFDAWVYQYVHEDLEEAGLGVDSPLKAAAWSISAARGEVARFASFGGIEGGSFTTGYKEFLAFGGMLGSGPPAFRLEQLLALCRAGIVSFIGPGVRVGLSEDGRRFTAESALVAGSRIEAPALLDAWMFAPTVSRTIDPLLASLIDEGRARAFHIDRADGSVCATDGVEIDRESSRLVDAEGNTPAELYAAGIPTEDARGFTIISPMPRTNSPMLRETDHIIRSILAGLPTETVPEEAAAHA